MDILKPILDLISFSFITNHHRLLQLTQTLTLILNHQLIPPPLHLHFSGPLRSVADIHGGVVMERLHRIRSLHPWRRRRSEVVRILLLSATVATNGGTTTATIGQAGIQVGNSCWELYCLEHGLQVPILFLSFSDLVLKFVPFAIYFSFNLLTAHFLLLSFEIWILW